jgi:hemerythrin-like domain-containing protein
MPDANTWSERTPLNGEVDFTMMYIAHDAFTRDLQHLRSASEQGRAQTREALASWAMFTKQLHTHHTAEDNSLWPRLRAAVVSPAEVDVLDAMEMEHAQIDPQLERVDAAFAARDASALAEGIQALATGLGTHMRHEENEALPLVERYLGRAGWAAFGQEIRKSQGGLRGGAQYLPWVLDGAPEATKAKVLRLLPPPARILYRRIWAPKYNRTARWVAG